MENSELPFSFTLELSLVFHGRFPQQHWIMPPKFLCWSVSFWIYTFTQLFTVLPCQGGTQNPTSLSLAIHLSLKMYVHHVSIFKELFSFLLIKARGAWFPRTLGIHYCYHVLHSGKQSFCSQQFCAVLAPAINWKLRAAGEFLPEPIWLVKQADSILCSFCFISQYSQCYMTLELQPPEDHL